MAHFRLKEPKRRDNIEIKSDYHDYKDDLKQDFNNRCGYCDSKPFGIAPYEIDHFVPQKLPNKKISSIAPNEYSNLVYSCKSCNRAKSNKWPTCDEAIYIKNNKGFVDPCNEEYSKHFDRDSNGKISPIDKLGEWMYNALKLHKPQHQVIWTLECIEKNISRIESIINKNGDTSLYKQLSILNKSFREYLSELSEYA